MVDQFLTMIISLSNASKHNIIKYRHVCSYVDTCPVSFNHAVMQNHDSVYKLCTVYNAQDGC